MNYKKNYINNLRNKSNKIDNFCLLQKKRNACPSGIGYCGDLFLWPSAGIDIPTKKIIKDEEPDWDDVDEDDPDAIIVITIDPLDEGESAGIAVISIENNIVIEHIEYINQINETQITINVNELKRGRYRVYRKKKNGKKEYDDKIYERGITIKPEINPTFNLNLNAPVSISIPFNGTFEAIAGLEGKLIGIGAAIGAIISMIPKNNGKSGTLDFDFVPNVPGTYTPVIKDGDKEYTSDIQVSIICDPVINFVYNVKSLSPFTMTFRGEGNFQNAKIGNYKLTQNNDELIYNGIIPEGKYNLTIGDYTSQIEIPTTVQMAITGNFTNSMNLFPYDFIVEMSGEISDAYLYVYDSLTLQLKHVLPKTKIESGSVYFEGFPIYELGSYLFTIEFTIGDVTRIGCLGRKDFREKSFTLMEMGQTKTVGEEVSIRVIPENNIDQKSLHEILLYEKYSKKFMKFDSYTMVVFDESSNVYVGGDSAFLKKRIIVPGEYYLALYKDADNIVKPENLVVTVEPTENNISEFPIDNIKCANKFAVKISMQESVFITAAYLKDSDNYYPLKVKQNDLYNSVICEGKDIFGVFKLLLFDHYSNIYSHDIKITKINEIIPTESLNTTPKGTYNLTVPDNGYTSGISISCTEVVDLTIERSQENMDILLLDFSGVECGNKYIYVTDGSAYYYIQEIMVYNNANIEVKNSRRIHQTYETSRIDESIDVSPYFTAFGTLYFMELVVTESVNIKYIKLKSEYNEVYLDIAEVHTSSSNFVYKTHYFCALGEYKIIVISDEFINSEYELETKYKAFMPGYVPLYVSSSDSKPILNIHGSDLFATAFLMGKNTNGDTVTVSGNFTFIEEKKKMLTIIHNIVNMQDFTYEFLFWRFLCYPAQYAFGRHCAISQ